MLRCGIWWYSGRLLNQILDRSGHIGGFEEKTVCMSIVSSLKMV
jgi:hypothetical protein